jgi:hypothetical protein
MVVAWWGNHGKNMGRYVEALGENYNCPMIFPQFPMIYQHPTYELNCNLCWMLAKDGKIMLAKLYGKHCQHAPTSKIMMMPWKNQSIKDIHKL